MTAARIPIAFRIALRGPDAWADAEGWIAPDLAPHLAGVLTPVVHRLGKSWRVSDLETGRHISIAKQRRIAEAGANWVLAFHDVASARKALNRGPRWMRQA